MALIGLSVGGTKAGASTGAGESGEGRNEPGSRLGKAAKTDAAQVDGSDPCSQSDDTAGQGTRHADGSYTCTMGGTGYPHVTWTLDGREERNRGCLVGGKLGRGAARSDRIGPTLHLSLPTVSWLARPRHVNPIYSYPARRSSGFVLYTRHLPRPQPIGGGGSRAVRALEWGQRPQKFCRRGAGDWAKGGWHLGPWTRRADGPICDGGGGGDGQSYQIG